MLLNTNRILLAIALFLICQSTLAQYKFGAQGGMGVSNYVGADYSSQNESKTGIMLGVFFERELNPTLSFGVEFTFEKKGTNYDYFPRETTIVNIDSRMSYISLPILMKAYFGRNANFYTYTGITGSRLIDHSLSHSATQDGYVITSDPFFSHKLNSWDASIIAGFGLNFYEIILDIRYHHGIVNIYEGHNAPSIRNHFLSATIGFSIFKKEDIRCFRN